MPERIADRRVAGVDGCRSGWIYAEAVIGADGRLGAVTVGVVPRFGELLDRGLDRIVVDIPIGLLEAPQRGGRAADIAACRLLGAARGSSVFPAPPRPALDLRTFDDPARSGFGLTLQAFGILPKILEVDSIVDPASQAPTGRTPQILESHPEVIFCDLNHGVPVAAPKRTAAGAGQRRRLLETVFAGGLPSSVPKGAARDDLLDALACLWVAGARAEELSALPTGAPPRDARGLAMQIVRRAPTGGLGPVSFAAPGAGAEPDQVDRRTRRDRLNERLRAAFIAGAEEDSMLRLGRGLTADELEPVLRRYPGDL